MFRLIRLVLFVLIAFVAGVLFERSARADRCLDAGGRMNDAGFCEGMRGP